MIEQKLMDRVFGPLLDRLLGLGEARTEHVEVRRDLAMPLPDGTTLATDHYRPAEVDRGPVVLVRTPYDKSNPMSRAYGLGLARRGLQVVVQDVRGCFGSAGDFEPFRHERDDGLATLDWVRDQQWCDGRIAMAGASYFGYTQWAVAPYADPKLSAVALGVTASDFRPTFYPGRSVGWQLALAWSSSIGTQEDRMPPWQRFALRRKVSAAMPTLPASRADLAAIGKRVQFLHDVVEHAEPDDHHWDFLDHGQQLAELGTPASMVAGWYDIFLPQQLRDFTALQEAGVPARLTVGPWWHGQPSSLRAIYRDQIDWLTGHLLDDKLILSRPPARLFLQGADRWLDFDRWPVEAETRELHLHADGWLRSESPTSEANRAFRYDPGDPTPIIGGAPLNAAGGQADNRAIEGRDDVLTYQTEPLEHDLDVIGESTATVFVRTDHADTDVFVRVCDVGGNGRSLNVIEGIRRLRPGDPAEDDQGVRKVEVELLPTAYRFLRGHRLRVQISGGGFPNYIRNHQTGEPIATASHTQPGRTQILHGPEHPTKITLPVVQA
ncbi:CocE/NonD family hydrolase [Microlunatus elymi]|uniref:CocE/NonD family hydrolase n=1 Tax=Microlunatus elymi TaxID=2596828 RepID=A0A516PYI0_9ACTN|nr:CocE/NonD family hydrolase [Microlunatus elymi]QDP96202.1 CocE/NonD family hydrolase [Microlunatus elymi]